jgi:hypothetical protein
MAASTPTPSRKLICTFTGSIVAAGHLTLNCGHGRKNFDFAKPVQHVSTQITF